MSKRLLIVKRCRSLTQERIKLTNSNANCENENYIKNLLSIKLLRMGYQLDATAEMYLATITTERERTSALMRLTVPQVAQKTLFVT